MLPATHSTWQSTTHHGQERPLPVELHTSVGSTATGTVSLEKLEDGITQLVVKAKG